MQFHVSPQRSVWECNFMCVCIHCVVLEDCKYFSAVLISELFLSYHHLPGILCVLYFCLVSLKYSVTQLMSHDLV